MTNTGQHRATADSKRGRSLISPGIEHTPYTISKEIADWNKKVEAKRRDKILLKAAAKRAAEGAV